MTKLVQLALSKIKYAGDSIGDDIRVEIDCLNHSLDFSKAIKNKSETRIDKTVGGFFTDQSSFSLPLSVRVIERDLIFNDVGTTEQTFAVDTRIATPQHFILTVDVLETRNYQTKKRAVFEITFEAKIADAFAYVSLKKSDGGWITVQSEGKEEKISLPAYLKVRLEREERNRQYFTIMEGVRRGEKASITFDEDGSSFLQNEDPHTSPVHFIYSLSTRILKLNTKRYTTLDYKNDEKPWERRLYTVAIPDYPHEGGRAYLDRAALALVWFKTSHPDNKRYVHPGAYTAGCVTLTEIGRWDELCKILLTARKGDGFNIGTMEVVP